jgi:hypothetical protein
MIEDMIATIARIDKTTHWHNVHGGEFREATCVRLDKLRRVKRKTGRQSPPNSKPVK